MGDKFVALTASLALEIGKPSQYWQIDWMMKVDAQQNFKGTNLLDISVVYRN